MGFSALRRVPTQPLARRNQAPMSLANRSDDPRSSVGIVNYEVVVHPLELLATRNACSVWALGTLP